VWDRWWRNELAELITGRAPDSHLKHEELVRGKYLAAVQLEERAAGVRVGYT